MHRERGDVHRSVAQRRRLNRKHIQTKIQVFAKTLGLHFLPQITVGSRHDPYIHLAGPLLAHSLELPLLQHTQQLTLQIQRDLTNLIKE
ncbi:hypothetical protein D3C80_688690 [compost metagenome]